MQKTLEKYQDLASTAVDAIADQRWKIVAILANKKPISVATNNLYKTHPDVDAYNPNRRMHAELRCLIKAPKEKIINSIIYVWRFGRNGELMLARPCPMCFKKLRDGGVKKMVYSTCNGFVEYRI